MKRGHQGRLGALWNIYDQAVNSLGNLLLSVVVASQVSAKAFGTYAIVIGLYLLLLSVEQALIGEPMLVLVGDGADKNAHGWGAAAALQLGIVSGGLLGFASLFLPRDLSGPMLALAVLLPALMLQDALRFVAFSQGAAREALLSDTVWTVGQIGLTIAVLLVRPENVGALIAAWALGAGFAAALSYRRLGLRRIPWLGTHWFTRTRYLSSRYLVESMGTVGAFQVAIWITGAVAGLGAAGALRLAQVVFGPVHVVFNGWRSYLTPRCVHALQQGQRVGTLLRSSALGLLAVTSVVAGGLALLPGPAATRLFGPTWALTRPLLFLVFLQKAFESLGLAPFAYLRATKRVRLTLMVRCIAASVVILGTLIATPRWGVKGSAVALTIASVLTSTVWWLSVVKATSTLHRLPGYLAGRRLARLACVRWRHRRPRSEDLFVVSYPKSGNTWLRFVLADAYSGSEPDFDKVEGIAPRVGEHHSVPPLLGVSGRLIKSHEPRHRFFGPMPGRHLCVVRDGRDVAVSYYYHMLRRGLAEPDFSAFLARFLTGSVDNYGPWNEHVTTWLAAARRDPDRVAVVRYEDLLEDAASVTRAALIALGCPTANLEESFERHSSERMREKESSSRLLEREQVRRIDFVRGARAGDWTTHFSEADLDLFWKHAGPAMQAAGYLRETAATAST